jgi:hypothetical protein
LAEALAFHLDGLRMDGMAPPPGIEPSDEVVVLEASMRTGTRTA